MSALIFDLFTSTYKLGNTKVRITILFLVLFGNSFFSQKADLGLNFGFNLPNSNSIIGIQEVDINDNQYSISNVVGSFSSGACFGLHSSLKIHENIALTMGINFFKSAEINIYHYDVLDTIIDIRGTASQKIILPGLKFIFPLKKIYVFANSSVILPLNTETKIKETKFTSASEIYSLEKSINYNFNIGFQFGLGTELQIKKKIKISLSLNSNQNYMTAKASKVKAVSQKGLDVLDQQTAYYINTIYHKNLNNFSNNATYNALTTNEKAKDELTFKHDFSSFGIRIGLVYVINSRIRE